MVIRHTRVPLKRRLRMDTQIRNTIGNILTPRVLGVLILTYWRQDRMAAISQMTFSNEFCWMKTVYFDDNLNAIFPQGPINQNLYIVSKHTINRIFREMENWISSQNRPLIIDRLTYVHNAIGSNHMGCGCTWQISLSLKTNTRAT